MGDVGRTPIGIGAVFLVVGAVPWARRGLPTRLLNLLVRRR